jgi:transposase
MNQIPGFLIECGITIRKGPSHLTTRLQGMLDDADAPLSSRLRLLVLELKHEWEELEKRIEAANAELQRIARQDDACHRLMEIPGFGPLVSTALMAAIGNVITFRKGRYLAAWLGLEHFSNCYRVPKRSLNHASAFSWGSCGSNSEMA